MNNRDNPLNIKKRKFQKSATFNRN